ncbi:gag pre-integrs domain-containing protein [Abeliophyllum distichum]|uniref:Gag pre-integrs domain-containing protein n=1 Tax=Abeliophyllum distichum TaxID=126358 RepID=A0ABD1R7L2_9LAMI
MDPSVDLETNLDNFSKLSQDLASCGEKFSDEHQAIILLNDLPDTFKDVRNAIEYGRDSLTTEIVVNFLRTKNLDIQQQNLNSVKGEGLNVRGRSLTRQNGHYENHQNGKKKNFKGQSRSKSRAKGVLDDIDFSVKIDKGVLKVAKGSLVMFKGIKQNGIFVVSATALTEKQSALSVINDQSDTLKWHKRLAHVSNKGLSILSKNGVFGKDKVSDLHFCETCILGKLHKLHFNTGTHKSKGILDYIHSDLWGPSHVPTMGGSVYFLSIIDDFSRKVWVFLLKHKSDTFEKFKQ